MKRTRLRALGVAIASLALVASMAGSALAFDSGGTPAAIGPDKITWTGQGATGGVLDEEECPSIDTLPEGIDPDSYLHWILTTDGGEADTDATLHLGGSGSGDYATTKNSGGAFHFFTPYFTPDGSLTAEADINVLETGNGSWILTISHGCPGDTTVPDAAPLTVKKTAAGSYDQKYKWDISKAVSPTGPIYTNANTVTLNYTVVATRSGPTVSNVKVEGLITVTNPNADTVKDVALSDALSDNTICATEWALADVPTGDKTSTYTCTLGSLPYGAVTNKATATWGEQVLAPSGAFLAAGSANGSADVAFTGNTIDDCVNVSDSVAGDLGTTCDTKTFTYSRTITVAPGCTDYPNTATFTTNTTGTTGSADASVKICQTNKGGFTMGYWQNKNGQTDIKAFGMTFCASLKTAYPNVLGTGTPALDCSTDAKFASSVSAIIKAADSSADGVAMFRAQFLATALSVKKTPALGTTGVSVNGSLLGTGNCLSVNALLAAADTAFPTLKTNKTNLLTVKTYFDDINNNIKVTC